MTTLPVARTLKRRPARVLPETRLSLIPLSVAPKTRTLLATSLARGDSLEMVARQRQALRRILSPDDDRYLEFQVWQEGVPRYVEIAAADAAARAGEASDAFRRLADYVTYAELANRLRRDLDRQLAELNLARERRIAFYSLGAGIALLLERSDGSWKKRYQEHLFTLLSP